MAQNEIKTDVSADEFSELARQAKHSKLIFESDLNMSFEVEVFFVNDEGQKIFDLIQQMPVVDGYEEKKNNLLRMYHPKYYTHHTRGSFVDPATGDIVTSDFEGAIPELDYLQAITMEQLATMTGETEVLPAIYKFMEMKMLQMDQMDRY